MKVFGATTPIHAGIRNTLSSKSNYDDDKDNDNDNNNDNNNDSDSDNDDYCGQDLAFVLRKTQLQCAAYQYGLPTFAVSSSLSGNLCDPEPTVFR